MRSSVLSPSTTKSTTVTATDEGSTVTATDEGSTVTATDGVNSSDVLSFIKPPFSTLIDHQYQKKNTIPELDTAPAQTRNKHVSVESVVGHSIAFSFRDSMNTNSYTSIPSSSISRATISRVTSSPITSTVRTSVVNIGGGGMPPYGERYSKRPVTLRSISGPSSKQQQQLSPRYNDSHDELENEIIHCTGGCPLHCGTAFSSVGTRTSYSRSRRNSSSNYETSSLLLPSTSSKNNINTNIPKKSERSAVRTRGVTRLAWNDDNDMVTGGKYSIYKSGPGYYGYNHTESGTTKRYHRNHQRISDSDSIDSNYTASTTHHNHHHRDIPSMKSREPPTLHRIVNGDFTSTTSTYSSDKNIPRTGRISSEATRSLPPRSHRPPGRYVGTNHNNPLPQLRNADNETQLRQRSASARRSTDRINRSKRSQSIVESRAFISSLHGPRHSEYSINQDRVLVVSSLERDARTPYEERALVS